MGRIASQHQSPILKAREARLQDLRWRRDVDGSSAGLAVPVGSPANAGVRTVAPGFSRGTGGSVQVGARFSGRERGTSRLREVLSPAKAGSRNWAPACPPAEAGGYGSYGGFAGGELLVMRSVNG
jgi:hypothetical protein